MQILMLSIDAILPMFILVGIGMVLSRFSILTDQGVKEFNNLAFNILTPIMFFDNVYSTGGKIAASLTLAVLILVIHVIEFLIAMATAHLICKDDEQKGVVQQLTFRSNMILFGTAIASAVLSTEELGFYSIAMMFILPIQNAGSALAQNLYSTKGTVNTVGKILKDVIVSPLNVGVVLGYLFAIAGISIPSFAQSAITQMSDAALPIGSILLGASLSVGNISSNLRTIIPVTIVKLLVLPLLMVPLIPLFNLTLVESYILMMLCAAPSATMTYTISVIEDWDVELACEAIIFNTVCSFFTLTLWTSVLLNML